MGKIIYISCVLIVYCSILFYRQCKNIKKRGRFSFLICIEGLIFPILMLIYFLNDKFVTIMEYSICMSIYILIYVLYFVYYEITLNNKDAEDRMQNRN